MKSETELSQFDDNTGTVASEASIEEIIDGFRSSGDRIHALINSLVRDKREMAEELSYSRDKESKLSEELTNLRATAEKFNSQTLKLADLDRKYKAQQESIKLIEDELEAKGQALTQLKSDYKEALEELSGAKAENDSLNTRCSDLEIKQEQLHETTESLNVALADKKRLTAELEAKLFEQTGVLSETQAKFLDSEETVQKLSEQLVVQRKELKETRWEALELQEEVRVLKVELARKSSLLLERERDLEGRAETIRAQQEQIAGLEAELRRVNLRIAKNEENLSAASQKISAQSTQIVQFERSIVRAQQELERREQSIRGLEEKNRLLEDDREALENEVVRIREIAEASKGAVQSANQRAEELNVRLQTETRQRMEAVKMRDDIRLELASTREKAIQLQRSLSQLSDLNSQLNEQLRLVRGDFESLDSEHKSVLRTEAHQSRELEAMIKELSTKTELVRELQSQNAGLREKLDITQLKFEQQAATIEESREKLSKLNSELAVYRKRTENSSPGTPYGTTEVSDLKQELESKELLIKQQDQLIQVLQARVGEKRVVAINPRDPGPDAPPERLTGNLRQL
jgi:chromosome segregation ATPase